MKVDGIYFDLEEIELTGDYQLDWDNETMMLQIEYRRRGFPKDPRHGGTNYGTCIPLADNSWRPDLACFPAIDAHVYSLFLATGVDIGELTERAIKSEAECWARCGE